MADTTALKNRIRVAIKTNDNQEIIGPVLQQTLLDIVDELDLNPELQEADTQLNNLEEDVSQLEQKVSRIENNDTDDETEEFAIKNDSETETLLSVTNGGVNGSIDFQTLSFNLSATCDRFSTQGYNIIVGNAETKPTLHAHNNGVDVTSRTTFNIVEGTEYASIEGNSLTINSNANFNDIKIAATYKGVTKNISAKVYYAKYLSGYDITVTKDVEVTGNNQSVYVANKAYHHWDSEGYGAVAVIESPADTGCEAQIGIAKCIGGGKFAEGTVETVSLSRGDIIYRYVSLQTPSNAYGVGIKILGNNTSVEGTLKITNIFTK